MPEHAQAVASALVAWPDVHARTHWLLGDEGEVDGADFYLGENEIGHIHLEGEAHIAVPARLRARLIALGLARPFRWSKSFVLFNIARASDVAKAEALFRLAYDHVRGVDEDVLLARN